MSAPLPSLLPAFPESERGFLEWCRDYALVQTAQGWAPLVLTPGQWEALCCLGGFFAGEQGIYAAIKARQVGWTTLLLLWSLWKMISKAGARILWLTPREEPIGVEVLNKWKDLIAIMQTQAGCGLDVLQLRNHSKNETVLSNGSRLVWQHIGGTETLAEVVARSGTFGWCIWTEAAYPDDAHLARVAIESGLKPALEKWRAPLMMDSTCNGSDGPGEVFYSMTQEVLRGGSVGSVRLLPWWTSPDYRDSVEDVVVFIAGLTEEERGLMQDFGLVAGQIAWRRRVRGSTPESIRRFIEKYPERSIAESFLQKGGSSVVNSAALSEAEARLIREGHGALGFAQIEGAGLRRVGARDPLFKDDGERGYFRVWGLPSWVGRTWAHLDCSDGHAGSDWQCLSVVGEVGDLVALLKVRVDKLRLAGAVQRVVEWFGCEELSIEAQGGGGEVGGHIRRGVVLRDRGIDPAELEALESPCSVRVKIEHTSEDVRGEIIDEALRYFEDGSKVPDLETLADLRDLRRIGGRIDHRAGGHDDSIFAVGGGLRTRRRALLRDARKAGGGGRAARGAGGSERGRKRGGGEFRVGGRGGKRKGERYDYLG